MGLEEIIREAVKRGITHLSLHPVQSEDHKTTYWRCSATPSTMHKYVSVTTLDPIEAITQTLAAMPKAKKRTPAEAAGRGAPKFDSVNPPLSELAQREVTAAVSDPMPHTVPDVLPGDLDEWSRFK